MIQFHLMLFCLRLKLSTIKMFIITQGGYMRLRKTWRQTIRCFSTPKKTVIPAQSEIPVHLLNYQVSIVKVKRIV